MTDRLVLVRPDDWHLHLRDGALMNAVLAPTARVFGRGMIMPNLKPPVTTSAGAAAYRQRIVAARPAGSDFQPLMALYLTQDTDPDDLEAGVQDGVVHAVKFYPAGATTNSEAGVTELGRSRAVLERLEKLGVPLLVHGEVTTESVDIFDREARFLDQVLEPLLREHAGLRVVVEHATTAQAVDFVREHPGRVGCTLTPQHLLANRNDMLVGGIRPHLYCLPILKRRSHQRALLAAATSGDPQFFLGTDSAPHVVGTKQNACGCAGCFSAPTAIELYAAAFEAEGALDKLEAFASLNGPRFYGLPANAATITLERSPQRIPEQFAVPGIDDQIVPLFAGRELQWRVA